MSVPAWRRGEMAGLANRAGVELDGADPVDVLRWAARHFADRMCVTSSMADAVVAHLASRALPGVDVLFLDTGYHFAETIGTRDAVAATLPVNVRTVHPRRSVAEQDTELGARLHERDPDRCCALRKVEPLTRALAPYHAWVAGLRRDETGARSDIRVVEWNQRHNIVKINPIAAWTQADVDAYVTEHGVLVNPLVHEGYPSIGCAPCTRPVASGGATRSGRWAGTGKSECGLHTT